MAEPSIRELLDMYSRMLLIRKVELFALEHHGRTVTSGEALFQGMMHLCIGQEATAVGACAALRRDDYIVCTYRNHGQILAKGAALVPALAEFMGRSTGYNGGKAGSMHITIPEIGCLGSFGTVGVSASIAVGAGYAALAARTDQVAVGFFGDGAINTGILAESFNLAALWKVPVIFFCENNQYAITTPLHKVVPITDLSIRSAPYGIPAVQVDGYDVLAVRRVTAEAVERARAGGGPTFIEALTYRLTGHLVGDRWDPRYRRDGEYDRWKTRDPIERFPEQLQADFGVSREQLLEIESEVERTVASAVEEAALGPFPVISDASTQVFAPARG